MIVNKYLLRRLRLLFIVSFSLLCLLLYSNQSTRRSTVSSKTPSPSGDHLVLLWTDLFDERYWHQQAYFDTSTSVTCKARFQCRFTRDRTRLAQASLVAFHLYDIAKNELAERQPSRPNEQSWVFITGESPVNFYYQNPSFYPRLLDDTFDGSISYKYDSPFSIFSNKFIHRSAVSHEQRQLNANSVRGKRKAIVWFVSNCVTFSRREKYVEQLRRFIPVDIYGACGIQCSTTVDRQCHVDLHEYFFYLAFENSRCNSYITEKFWKIISDDDHRLVPIVMGPSERDYARVAPNQSYIHVNMYPSPEALAKYLRYLMDNPDKYLQHLQWREHSSLAATPTANWSTLLCPLCQMSYDSRPSARLNFSSWYSPQSECHRDDVAVFKTCKQSMLNRWMGWIHQTQCP